MPAIPKDTTDRNRTSPLAFTGNKFEFRMLGSSQSIAGPNIALNTIMAEELSKFADVLEQAEDFDAALHNLVCKAFTDHQRIIFDGNGYSGDWQVEAAQRGLSNLPSTPHAMPSYISPKNIELVTKHGIFTEPELRARYAIHLESYNKIVNIEAKTMLDMAMRQILPGAMTYIRNLSDGVVAKKSFGAGCKAETSLITRLSDLADQLYDSCEQLKAHLALIPADFEAASCYYQQTILSDMAAIREAADELETLTDRNCWPFPTYADLLYY